MTTLSVWEQLIKSLQCLPHVGPKSAQRIAFHLLTREREAAIRLVTSLSDAIHGLKHCEWCRNFSSEPRCALCANPSRQRDLLCIVESPMDLMAFEQTQRFEGLYFVLMGALSPLEGIGPDHIGLDALRARLTITPDHPVREVVLATNFTNEGETTAHIISEILASAHVQVTRLAHGVPVGGELEYLDMGTIAQAYLGRKRY